MGYNTSFELGINYLGTNNGNDRVHSELIIDELRKFSEGANYSLDEDGDTNESCKWYEHDQDMREFSKNYPDWLFTLHGEGEDAGDIWNKYFRDGYMQEARAVISFADYDNSKFLATRRDDKITKVLG